MITAVSGKILATMTSKTTYAIKDYGFRYGPKWLMSGDTIISSTWEIYDASSGEVSADLTIESDTIIESDKTTQVFLGGGIACKTYKVVNKIETAGGRREAFSFLLPVIEP